MSKQAMIFFSGGWDRGRVMDKDKPKIFIRSLTFFIKLAIHGEITSG